MIVYERPECRNCGAILPSVPILDLGEQEVISFPKPGEKGKGRAPLQLVNCSSCHLLQLKHTVDEDSLYRVFWYESGVNEQMKLALADVVQGARKWVTLLPKDVVVDIGSNDGTLLGFYPSGTQTVGFEPAEELAVQARKNFDGIFLADYFRADLYKNLNKDKLAKIITACAMFYDLDAPEKFLGDVYEIMHPEGIFIVQMNYLPLMIRNLTFDNVSHEHLAYYSLAVLIQLFKRRGLVIVDVETNGVNGGSIRVYARKRPANHSAWKVRQSVTNFLQEEREVITAEAYTDFADKVRTTAREIKEYLIQLKKAGKVVYAYGASTRGATLLQTILGSTPAQELLAGVAERNEKKYGRTFLGLAIVPEREARTQAELFFLNPWHFWQSISQREKTWMLTGGKFILPLPIPKVVGYSEYGTDKKMVLQARGLDEATAELVQ